VREITIRPKKGGRSLLRRQEFYEREVSEGLKGCQPGEWVFVSEGPKSEWGLLCLANPTSERSAPLRVLKALKRGEEISPDSYVREAVAKAIYKRRLFQQLEKGCRLVYGEADGLPGVIIDEYVHCVVIQINTAGMDQHRDLIKSLLGEETKKNCYFLDNEEYRKAEGLPIYNKDNIPALEVQENGLKYLIKADVLQKVGYYYDHRQNRKTLSDWLKNYEGEKSSGIDLFSYVGSWGMNMLGAGVEKVTFVDQGDFDQSLKGNLDLNGFTGRGNFERANVFEWLKSCKKTYDVVVSDPPAFSKSLKNKSKALGGYQKLHRSLSKIVHEGSLMAIGSCTHGVTLDELDQTVHQGFQDSEFSCQLLDLGHQGCDHPIEALNSTGHYIKFLLYLIVKS
jgi:23S rRNA (cytosine1962-C5)-methyltransferase